MNANTRLRIRFEFLGVENIANAQEITITNEMFLTLEDSFEIRSISRTTKENTDFGCDNIAQITKLRNGTAS